MFYTEIGKLTNQHSPMNYYCKYCGTKAASIASLAASPCFRYPAGANKGKHTLYQGDEKSKYECQYCGTAAPSISSLTASPCFRHPLGPNKGHHEPAL
jgi:DNA-directed RNA polymerase subunit RPC12/RpoP